MRVLSIRIVTFVTIFFITYGIHANTNYDILLKSGTVITQPNFEAFLENPVPGPKEVFKGKMYKIIQFEQIPNATQRQAMQKKGVTFLSYLPHNAYLVSIPKSFDFQLLKEDGIRAVLKVENTFKLHPDVASLNIPAYAIEGDNLKITVNIHADQDMNEVLLNLLSTDFILDDNQENIHLLYGQIPYDKVQQLAEKAYVQFIELVTAPPVHDDHDGRGMHRVNLVNHIHSSGRKYDGTDIAILVRDDGLVGPHIDYHGRLTNLTTANSGIHHGDMVAGIFTGAGNLDPTQAGGAPGATVFVVDYEANFNNGPTLGLVSSDTVLITNSSYSDVCNAGYTNNARTVDIQMHDNPSLLHIFSAGNSNGGCGFVNGFYNITGGHKASKNSIACANLNQFNTLAGSSSRGPVRDGRIKPELASYGDPQISTDPDNQYSPGGGTSAAAPSVAGVTTTLYHAYRVLNNYDFPESALIKGCMLNTADDLGNAGPDFLYGFGRINGYRAVKVLENNYYMSDTLDQSESDTHQIAVPANVAEFRALVIWLEPEANAGVARPLINNLDFRIEDPNNITWTPWVLDITQNATNLALPATRGTDSLNNVEQITLANPAAGTFDLIVDGTSVGQGPQKYWLVYEFVYDTIEVTYPAGGEGFVPNEAEIIRWDAYGSTGSFTVEYTTDNGSSWNMLSSSVAGSRRYYQWNNIPNSVSDEARIRVSRNGIVDESDYNFAIIDTPGNIQIVEVCPNSHVITWDAVTGAGSYDAHALGDRFMDSMGTTATNTFRIMGIQPYNDNWVSVKANGANGGQGRRANAVFSPMTNDLSSCSILSRDVWVKRVLSPPNGEIFDCHATTGLNVQIELQNNGSSTLSNIPVFYQFNGGAVVSGTATSIGGTSSGSNVIQFSFAPTIDLNSFGNNTLRVWSGLSNDEYRFNDTLEINVVVVNSASIVNVPYQQDFELFSNCGTNTNCEGENCTLGDGWRNWTNGTSDDIDWRSDENGTATGATGPNLDHTINGAGGQYVYLEASGGCSFREAIMMSPCINLAGASSVELSYWYHMFGSDMGELHVDVFDGTKWDLDVTPVISGNQGDQWVEVRVDLNSYIGNIINVRFRGITGNDIRSDMALDDINITGQFVEPQANFAIFGDKCVADDMTYQFNGVGSNLSYIWDFGSDASPATANTIGPHSVQYSTTGVKIITLILDNGATQDTVSKFIDIGDKATPDFEFQTLGRWVNFMNLTSGADSYNWNFGDGTSETQFSPSHVFWNLGNYDVTLTATNRCGSAQVTKNVAILAVGIEQAIEDDQFLVYPNPSDGHFTFVLKDQAIHEALLELTDITAKEVLFKSTVTDGNKQEIDVSHLAAGTYLLNVRSEKNSKTYKLIIQ